jgi:molybdopterin converting factor small subunit
LERNKIAIIKFVGSLRHVSGAEKLTWNLEETFSVKKLINRITREIPSLERALIDQRFEDSTANTLILVNGKEISILNGLETRITDCDEVVFVPVAHGG